MGKLGRSWLHLCPVSDRCGLHDAKCGSNIETSIPQPLHRGQLLHLMSAQRFQETLAALLIAVV